MKKKPLPYIKVNNYFIVKTIIPFWLDTIHPPTLGENRNNKFKKIVNSLKNNLTKDFPKHWFLNGQKIPGELPLERSVLIGCKHRIDNKLNKNFKNIFTRMRELSDRKFKLVTNLNSINSYYFSYGIGFTEVITEIGFPNQVLKYEHIYSCYFDIVDTIKDLLIEKLLPPFNNYKNFQIEFSKSFSEHSDNLAYDNWLTKRLDRKNIYLGKEANNFRNSSFIELFIEPGQSILSKQYEYLEEKQIDDNIKFVNESLMDEKEDYTDEDMVYEDAASTKVKVLLEKEKKYAVFKNKENFLDFLNPKKVENSFFDNKKKIIEHRLGLFSLSDNLNYDDGDILLSINMINSPYSDEDTYTQNMFFVPYFIFKVITFNCLNLANLGLYANLFSLDKQANLSKKNYEMLSNGFLKSRNLLDILKLESSYETILNKTYKIFHDSSTENIERVINKNESLYDLIEQRIIGEREKQQKEFGEAVSLGLAIISILTIGLAAADLTDFLGFGDILSIQIKLPIVIIPVLIFILLLYLALRNKKNVLK